MSFSCRLFGSIPIKRFTSVGLPRPRRFQIVTVLCSVLVWAIIYTRASTKSICNVFWSSSSTLTFPSLENNAKDQTHSSGDTGRHQPNIEWFSWRMKNTEHFPLSYYNESTQREFKKILYWSDVDAS